MKLSQHIATLCFLALAFTASSQDGHFTQFYAAPTYLNPAFAGTSVESRLSANYRNQWPAIPGAFVTYNFAYDRYLPRIHSGIGIIATHDKAGAGALRSSSVGAQYSYEVAIRRDVFFLPALQMSYTNHSVNFSDLVFGDQLIRDGAETSLEAGIEPVNYLDFSSGALVFSPSYWAGVSIHHMNQPNQSFYPGHIARIPRKISAHGGYRFKMKGGAYSKSKSYVVTAANYKHQGDFDQLDLGAYYELNPLTLGLWYRGLLLKSNDYGYINQDALSLIVGFQSEQVKIGYSFDVTLSQLNVGFSGGAHEISFSYEWAGKQSRRMARKRIVPCAKF
jgi:type IX secretion system PorP/SprF family membrane protein